MKAGGGFKRVSLRRTANDEWVRVPPPARNSPADILFYFDGKLLLEPYLQNWIKNIKCVSPPRLARIGLDFHFLRELLIFD